jgi:hypothetical protein
MASSGTTAFNPAVSDLTITAYSRLAKPELRAAALTQEHLTRASMEANLLNVEWANRGYHLWKQETIQFPPSSTLTQGIFQYALPATTLMVTLVWIQLQPGSIGGQTDRVLGPLSAYEYKSIPNKLQPGPPTSWWYDRQIVPIMNLWPSPDNGGPYTALCQAFTQIQDVVVPGGVTLDAPYRFFDAFVAGLAKRLAVHYAPEKLGQAGNPAMGMQGTGLTGDYEMAWELATTADTDNRPLNLSPDFSGYYRM